MKPPHFPDPDAKGRPHAGSPFRKAAERAPEVVPRAPRKHAPVIGRRVERTADLTQMSPESQRRVARQLAADAGDREDRTRLSDGIVFRLVSAAIFLAGGVVLFSVLRGIGLSENVILLVVFALFVLLSYLGVPIGLPRSRRW